ncbi:hypothetical protein LT493_12590 [Streptomyces tricolor]|nr:hypothetical protein [Streptomyces tricolor]
MTRPARPPLRHRGRNAAWTWSSWINDGTGAARGRGAVRSTALTLDPPGPGHPRLIRTPTTA